MNAAVWGWAGYVGSALFDPARHLPVGHRNPLTLPGARLPEDVEGIIWCAGFPGLRNIDEVEKNPHRSYLQNVAEPAELAERCEKQGKRLLVISSGCLFHGAHPLTGNPYRECDPPNFIKPVYHRHKNEMENQLRAFPRVTIFRIRLPFDSRGHPRNLITKLKTFSAVWDAEQSYTWLPDLAKATRLWESRAIEGGIWHVTQPGTMNNFEAVKWHLNPLVDKISGDVDRPDPSMASPRSAAILDSSKLGNLLPLLPVKEAWLLACKEYGTQLA